MANEHRLIDANALSDAVAESLHDNPHPQGMIRVNHRNEHNHFLRMILDAPTVDAVVLPCKLGGFVYIIVKLKSGKPSHIVERKCTGIHITEKVFGKRAEKASRYLVTNSDIGFAQHIPFTEFGKTVFFDRKDAEAALAKMDGGNEDGNG